MIPKSLFVAIIVGVVAGGLMGLYLHDLNSHGTEFVSGPAISVSTDKSSHKVGESISIEIINSGTYDLVFVDEIPSIKIRALDGTVFFVTSLSDTKLEPKQKYIYTWNQQKNDNSKIIEGRYIIEVSAYDKNRQKISDNTVLNILK